jgi:hypothetical protein
MEKIPYFGQTLIRWRVGGSTFLALPEKGARLMNWNIEMGDGSVRDVIHWPEISSLADFHKARGGNPILFPFCARSFDRGRDRVLARRAGVRRPMPMHGLRPPGRVPGHARRRGRGSRPCSSRATRRGVLPFPIRVPRRVPLRGVRAHVQYDAREPGRRAAALERGPPLLLSSCPGARARRAATT